MLVNVVPGARRSNLLGTGEVQQVLVVGKQIRLRCEESLHGSDENLAGLGLELLLRGGQDLFENANQLRSQLLNSLVGLVICQVLATSKVNHEGVYVQRVWMHW